MSRENWSDVTDDNIVAIAENGASGPQTEKATCSKSLQFPKVTSGNSLTSAEMYEHRKT